MEDGIRSRADAIRIIFRWIRAGEFPDRLIGGVDSSRRAFVMELTYATVRWSRALDEVLAPRLRQRPPPATEAALLLGACQLLKLPGIPTYAAVHATMEALKEVGGRRSPTGLLNAVLRDIERNRETVLADLATRSLPVRTSHPDDLVADWTARWGAEQAEAICDWNNRPADVTVLTLPQGPDRDALLAQLRTAGVVAEPHPASPEAILLGHGIRVEELPGFASGDYAVQDPATLDAVRLLDVQPGLRVLDACASPGGKAARLARLLDGNGSLVALDRHADRLPHLRETLSRLARGTVADIRQADATLVTPEELGGPFDRVLLDVPCSNTGVLRRRPDARWRVEGERTRKLTHLQDRLLENTATLLAPGGLLVYSTCSLQRAENETRIDRFLERHPQYSLHATSFRSPPEMDGAFAAALRRNL